MPFLETLANRHLKDTANFDHVCMHILIGHCLQFNNVLNGSGLILTPSKLEEFTKAT